MTVVTINETGQTFELPETTHEVFFSQLLRFESEIEPTEPPEIKQEAELLVALKKATVAAAPGIKEQVKEVQRAMDVAWYREQMLPYMCRVLGCFTNQSPDVFMQVNKESLEEMYYSIENILFDTTTVQKQLYYVNGEVYQLPGEMLKSATVLDWVESSYFFEAAGKMDGRISGMLDVAASLLKKEGETLTKEVFERNKQNFVHLSLFDINCIAFFLLKLTEKSVQSTTLYSAIQLIKAMRRKEI